MSISNYTASISVSASRADAYRALTEGFAHWWTAPDHPIGKVGDRARFTFPPGKSFWTFEAVKLSPGEYVELECVDAFHVHEGEPEEIEREWLGTRAVWQIDAHGDEAVIRFEHLGLSPSLLCFGICQRGWDFFFLNSLKTYLGTGTGKPHAAPD